MFGIKSITLVALLTLDASSSVAHPRRLKRNNRRALSTAVGTRRRATGCYPAHREGFSYTEGSLVSSTKAITSTESCSNANDGGCINGQRTISTTQTFNYQCVTGANSVFCSMEGYDPAGVHGSIAWNELFACEVCISYSFSPLTNIVSSIKLSDLLSSIHIC